MSTPISVNEGMRGDGARAGSRRRRSRGGRLALVALVVGGAWLVVESGPAGAQTTPDASERAAVDSIFAEWDGTRGPGAAVAVVRDDSVLLTRGYGMADLERNVPVTTRSVFDLASVSKHFTGLALARLSAEGRLDLDADIRAYLPDYPDLGHTVTVRHLIHHTSGIRDWVELLWISGWRFDDVITMDDVWNLAVDQKRLNFAPGEEYAYSNTAYNFMAMIVEVVTGTPFHEYVAEEFFGPAGMHRTSVQADHQALVPDRTRSYQPREEGGFSRLANNTATVGSSSILSTAEDMAAWLRYLNRLEEERPEEARLFQTRGILNSGDTLGYAFGISVGEYRGERTWSHGGSWRGYRSHILRFPDHDLGVFVVSNSTAFSSGTTARAVAEVFIPDLDEAEVAGDEDSAEPSPEADAVPATPGWLERDAGDYPGRYWSPELTVHLEVVEGEDGVLHLSHRKHGATELEPGDPDIFTLDGIRGTQTVEFVRNEDGSVGGFRLSGARFQGVEFHLSGNGEPR